MYVRMEDFSDIFLGRKMTVTVGAAGTSVLDEVDLTLRRREWLAVVGHSGSGKSTLAKVLAGVCPLASGSAQWRLDAGQVRWVQQNPEAQLIGDTVWQDVSVGLAGLGEWADRALEALSRVGLADLRERKTETLSGGQKQLLAIAGALAAGVDTLVLDESTSMLDPLSQERVLEAVEGIHRGGAAIVWSTHSLEELAYAERVIVLDKGKLAFDGTPRHFFYGEEGEAREGKCSPCKGLGFAPPFAVEVAWELLNKGWAWEWSRLPLRPADFAELPIYSVVGGDGR